MRAEGHEIEPTPIVNRSIHIGDESSFRRKELKEIKFENKFDFTPNLSDLTISSQVH